MLSTLDRGKNLLRLKICCVRWRLEIQLHKFLGAPRTGRQRLAAIRADESEPFVELNGGIVAIEYPQKRGADAGRLKSAKSVREHADTHTRTAACRRDPYEFQVALVG